MLPTGGDELRLRLLSMGRQEGSIARVILWPSHEIVGNFTLKQFQKVR